MGEHSTALQEHSPIQEPTLNTDRIFALCYNSSHNNAPTTSANALLFSGQFMATPQSNLHEEPLRDLVARVRAMLPEIDLDRDMTEDMAGTIAVAEMSGTPLTETQKKLHVLKKLDRITSDEYMRIALERVIT